MHGKEEFLKTNSSISNILIEAGSICIRLLGPADSNGLIVLKLKLFTCRGYVYFVTGRQNVIYQALYYLKTRNKFYEYFSFQKGFQVKKKDKFFRY